MCNSLERLYEEKGINCNFSTFHLVVIYPLFIDFGLFSKNKKKCTIFFECSYPDLNKSFLNVITLKFLWYDISICRETDDITFVQKSRHSIEMILSLKDSFDFLQK